MSLNWQHIVALRCGPKPDGSTCDKCEQEFAKADCTHVNKSACEKAEAQGKSRASIFRCSGCSSLVGPVFRLKGSDPEAYGDFLAIKHEDRAEFFQVAQNKFGPDLRKVITEEFTEKTREYNRFNASLRAPAYSVAEAKKMQRFIDYPEALDRLLANPKMSYTCPLQGIPMVRVPESCLTEETGTDVTPDNVRSVSAQSQVRPLKAIKTTAAAKAKALPKGLLTKANKQLENTLTNMQTWQGSLIVCTTDIGKKYVGGSLVESIQTQPTAVQHLHSELASLVARKNPEEKQAIVDALDSMDKAANAMAKEYTLLEGCLAPAVFRHKGAHVKRRSICL